MNWLELFLGVTIVLGGTIGAFYFGRLMRRGARKLDARNDKRVSKWVEF